MEKEQLIKATSRCIEEITKIMDSEEVIARDQLFAVLHNAVKDTNPQLTTRKIEDLEICLAFYWNSLFGNKVKVATAYEAGLFIKFINRELVPRLYN